MARRRLSARLVRLPVSQQGRRRKGKLLGTGLVGAPVIRGHRKAQKGPPTPPAAGRKKRRQVVQITTANAPALVWVDPHSGTIPVISVVGGVMTLTWTAADGRVYTKTQAL